MRIWPSFSLPWHHQTQHLKLFCFGMFFLLLTDSTLTFAFPLILENHFHSNTLMGLVLGLSSVAGLISDFVFPQIFQRKKWRLFFGLALFFAFLFVVFVDFGASLAWPLLFVAGTITWGIYFELMVFSQQDYVVSQESPAMYSRDWGLIMSLWQISLILGPILGSFLLRSSMSLIPFCGLFLGIAFLSLLALPETKNGETKPTRITTRHSLSILKELLFWQELSKSVIAILAISFCLNLLLALMQSLGGLYGQEIFVNKNWESLFFIIFYSSSIIGSSFLFFNPIQVGKKRTALWSLFGAGFVLTSTYFWQDSVMLVVLTMIVFSIFFSFIEPLLQAVYSDLLQRTGSNRLHLLGLQKASGSLGFIVGPIVVGVLADRTSYASTFSLIGLFCALVALVLLIFMPRKIRLHQQVLQKIAKQ